MPLLIHAVAWWLTGLYLGAAGLAPGDTIASAGRLAVTMVLVVLCLLLLVWNGNGTGYGSRQRAGSGTLSGDTERRVAIGAGLSDVRWLAILVGVAGLLVGRSAAGKRDLCGVLLQRALKPDSSLVTSAGVDARLLEAPHYERASRVAFMLEVPGFETCQLSGRVRFRNADSWQVNKSMLHAGAVAKINGHGTIRSNGFRVDDARVLSVRGGDALLRWRSTIGARIDSLFGTRAPLVRALLIAEQDDLPSDLRERFADAGLVHMLSVSGMHVGIIASALLTLGVGLRVSRRWLTPLTLLVVAFYVALLGFPAPAVRSGVMLGVLALASQLQRPVHEWTALALGAALPSSSPLVVLDLGWQLSVGGMAALIAARALRRNLTAWARAPVPHAQAKQDKSSHGSTLAAATRNQFTQTVRFLALRKGFRGWILQEVFVGLVATVVTAPIIAWTFGRVSVVAPLSNIPGGVLVGVLQPALFLTLLLSPFPALAQFVADATQPLMALLDLVADAAGRLPGAVLPVSPSLTTAIGSGIALACVVRGAASQRLRRWWLASLVVLVLTGWVSLLQGGSGVMELHVMDVGQGDALAIRTPRGRWVVMDAGPSWQNGDAGRRTVLPHLRRRGGEVALFVLSHAHEDHAGGAASVIRALKPLQWWEPAYAGTSPGYREALNAVASSGSLWRRARPGESMRLDGVTFTVLAPDSAWTAWQQNANETSVILRVDYGAHRFLLTGDAEAAEEGWAIDYWGEDALRADVLKLGHHGSKTSSSDRFIDAVRPQVAVVSLGAGNRYGHPSAETLLKLLERHIPVIRTDREGDIIIRSNGITLEVDAGGERWVPDQR